MNSVLTREDILKEKVKLLQEGKVVLELFKIAEELDIGEEIKLQNFFSFEAMKRVYSPGQHIRIDQLYTSILNVYYVVELYLRGYYNQEHYIGYEQFINLVKAGKANEVIDAAHASFVLHINRLKKIISKSKKKIPRDNKFFRPTKELLEEIDRDLSRCRKYPKTSINLTEFYFGKFHENCGPITVNKRIGFIAMEKTLYSLYNELSIISKMDEEAIYYLCDNYVKNVGEMVQFNLFERVINNYIFAQPYSESPEDLRITKVDAELLLREIKLGRLNATELIDQLIHRYEFTGYNAEYLHEYGTYLESKLQSLRDLNYFGELFIVTPPD